MKNRTGLTGALILLIVAALTYLPLIHRFGYTHDDWYLMASARANGPSVFWDIFSVDRPYRALVMIPAYTLFGADPLYYNLSAFVFRLAGALAFLWSLNMLWPRHAVVTTSMALLFLIYPGFLSQPNGIDYQSHILGLAAALFSISFTLKAILSENRIIKILLHAASLLTGWLYLGQMEWYIGFEFFRWVSVFLLSSRAGGTFFQKAWRAVQWAYPSLAIPGLFLIWRLFFFHSQRGATDVDLQFSQFKLYPLQTIYHWTLQVAQDFFDVMLAAWAIPLSQLISYIQSWGALLAILTAGLVFFALYRLRGEESPSGLNQPNVSREAVLLGLLGTVGGLVPIAMVNRDVWFPSFSRYSLVSSVGVAILIPALLMYLKSNRVRNGIIAALCLISILTQHANALQYAQETARIRNFWWQVAWRVPQFEKNTTLVANIAGVATEEDYFVWGPAVLIYYPDRQNPEGIQPGLFAAILNKDTVTKVLARERQEFDNRKNIITYKNYRNIVVLTQPTTNSCVHVVDGSRPEYSQKESDFVRTIGTYSEIERVLADEPPHTPPELVFGPEPEHAWCYYYQKANLARQKGDWAEIIRLGDQASAQGLAPKNRIEWLPFLQAYAEVGDIDRLIELAPIVKADPYTTRQACSTLRSASTLSSAALESIDSLYCIE